MNFCFPLAIYLFCINLIAVMITVSDKNRAVKKKRRISERILFLVAILGGGICMYLTMAAISHKTRHKRFMIGIPAIIIIEAVLMVTAYNLVNIYG